VESFGDPNARLLIVGLAPGVTGANRTGRPFTGDWAGDLLYPTLAIFGFSKGRFKARPDDGLELINTMITNAVRCVPPHNKPLGAEVNTCRLFLTARIKALPRLSHIITLGKIAHDSTVRALGAKVAKHPFGHNASSQIGPYRQPDRPLPGHRQLPLLALQHQHPPPDAGDVRGRIRGGAKGFGCSTAGHDLRRF
jgi:uracil-DNA glycosylase family 4